VFTGIVEEVGRVAAVTPLPGLTRLRIESRVVPESLRTGDSVAVNGACLTVVARDGAGFEVEATLETLRRTNLGALTTGDEVHLERPLAANGRFDGHIVQGHVDAVGRIAGRRPDGDAVIATFAAPEGLMRYVVPKGSIAVDGVSLTVVEVQGEEFTVALIPHTQEATLLTRKPLGGPVNLEADVLAKYVERAVIYAQGSRGEPAGSPVDAHAGRGSE
jgi:riboflavin synthase